VLAAVRAQLGGPDAPDLLVSSGTEPLVLTSMLAGELGLPMAYLRPKPKEHGRQKRLEGELRGSRAALIALNPAPETVEDNRQLIDEGGSKLAKVIDIPSPSGRGLGRGQPRLREPSPLPSPAAAGEGSVAGVAKVLLDIGAVIIRQDPPFRYVSGILSPIYTDCRLLISYPEKWPVILDALQARIDEDAIVGVATSGIPHASVLAHRLGKPLAYVHDEGIAGYIQPDQSLVIVEDLVTTGKSVLECASALRQHGFAASRCVAIFTYERRQPSLEAAGIAFEPLADLATLLETGVAEGRFGEAERQAVLDWRRDPQAWTAAHEQ